MSIVEPKLATTVLLVRDRGGLEVLMVERGEKAHFGAALVFPGGLVDPEDHDDAWLRFTSGTDGLSVQERAVRIAGFRELHEETGILLVDADDPLENAAPGAAEQPFIDRIAKTGSSLDLEAMHPFAHWITPDFAPKRFDTHFRICGLDTGLTAVSDGFETVSVEWLRPADALALGASGERKVLFPTRLNLELLGKSSSVEEAIEASRNRKIVTVSPRMDKRADGAFIVVPPDAGYGPAEEPVGRMQG
jgi:8-oxo-dGTP pyrophosphatase MutT (NUDIX family)